MRNLPLILCIDDALLPAAEQVQRITGWKLIGVNLDTQVAAKIEKECVEAVLIILDINKSASILFEFLNQICDSDEVVGVSFLYGQGLVQLTQMAQRFTRVESDAIPPLKKLVYCHPDYAAFPVLNGYTKLSLAPNAAVDILKDLTEPMDLAVFVGHSNGHDAGFDGLVLCRHSETTGMPKDYNAFACYKGANCRFPSADIRRFNVNNLCAKRVVSLTCWGVQLSDFPFARSLSVGEGLLSDSAAEAVLTTVEAVPIEAADMLAICYLLDAGVGMGLISTWCNRLRKLRGLGADFVCFGRPDSRLPMSVNTLRCTENRNSVKVDLSILKSCPCSVRFPYQEKGVKGYVLVQNGHTLEDVIHLPDGFIYATLKEPVLTKDVFFKKVRLQNFQKKQSTYAALLKRTAYCELLVSSLMARSRTDGTAAVQATKVLYTLVQLRHLIRHFLKRMPVAGTILDSSAIMRLEQSTELELAFLQMTVLLFELCATHFSGGNGVAGMEATGEYLTLAETRVGICPCKRKSRLVELWRESRIDVFRRQIACCSACGPIYEGEGPWGAIEFSGMPRRGSNLRARVLAANSHGIKVHAKGKFWISRFNDNDICEPSVSHLMVMDDGGSAMLEAELQVPTGDSWVGVHYLCACVVSGIEVSFFRQPIILLS